MPKTKQEIVVVFFEDDQPVAIMRQNGHTEFFHLRHMNKDAVVELLGANETPKTGGA